MLQCVEPKLEFGTFWDSNAQYSQETLRFLGAQCAPISQNARLGLKVHKLLEKKSVCDSRCIAFQTRNNDLGCHLAAPLRLLNSRRPFLCGSESMWEGFRKPFQDKAMEQASNLSLCSVASGSTRQTNTTEFNQCKINLKDSLYSMNAIKLRFPWPAREPDAGLGPNREKIAEKWDLEPPRK